MVKSLLEHSRGSSGERRSVDLNLLIEEALNLAYHRARAQEPSFNITLQDQHFQSTGGPQFLVEIEQRFPDLLVMIVTAYGENERRWQAAEYGATEFLTKPVDFERLRAQLRKLPSAPDWGNSSLNRMTAYRLLR
jgi:DNA-binding NtrC family response regulator